MLTRDDQLAVPEDLCPPIVERDPQVPAGRAQGTADVCEQTSPAQASDPQHAPDGLSIARVIGCQDGLPVLSYLLSGREYTGQAVAVVGNASELAEGAIVCIAFDQRMIERPLVLGRFSTEVSVRLDAGVGTTIQDEQQIVIRCGKASINLKADGTVAIRGTNVASRATHTNRIRGGNVQIN